MSLDAAHKLPPLNQYVESSHEIRYKFDTTTYNKGSIILKMFMEVMTEATFTKGVRNYLISRQFQSASPEDLFNGLQQAFDEDFPDSHLDIASMMTP